MNRNRMRTYSIIVLLATTTAGCESAEETCNNSRVVANDAWASLRTAIAPTCAEFRDRSWRDLQQEAISGIGRAGIGRMSRRDGYVMGIVGVLEEHWGPIHEACDGVDRATSAATGPAIAFRDKTDLAIAAVEAMVGGHAAFATAAAAEDSEVQGSDAGFDIKEMSARLAQATREHSARMNGIDEALSAARDASAGSWDACQSVDP